MRIKRRIIWLWGGLAGLMLSGTVAFWHLGNARPLSTNLSMDSLRGAPVFPPSRRIPIPVVPATQPYQSLRITLNPPRDSDVDRWLDRIIVPELALLPDQLLLMAKLRSIILCRDLSVLHGRAGGTFDEESSVIWLSCTGLRSDHTMASRVHHELFHALDWAANFTFEDNNWEQLNGLYFQYSNHYGDDGSKPSVFAPDGLPGFVSLYAMASVAEDKAETFGCMMMEPDLIAERIKSDPVLRLKVEWIKSFLNRQCPEMDEAYWEKLAAHRRRQRAMKEDHY